MDLLVLDPQADLLVAYNGLEIERMIFFKSTGKIPHQDALTVNMALLMRAAVLATSDYSVSIQLVSFRLMSQGSAAPSGYVLGMSSLSSDTDSSWLPESQIGKL